jgi:hypothetical protein
MAPAPDRCDGSRIRAELEATGQFPNLRGCDPNAVRNALGDTDYGLQIESRDSSNHVEAGRIIRQHAQSGTVYVVVSTGPSHHGDGDQVGENVPGIFGAIAKTIIKNLPPPHQEAPPPPVIVQTQPPPPQSPVLEPPATEPVPPPPAQQTGLAEVVPEPVLPIVDSPAVADPPAKTKSPPPEAPKPVLPKSTPTPQIPLAPAAMKLANAAPAPQPKAPPQDGPAIGWTPPPPPQFSITGSARLTGGDDFEPVISRQGNDHASHRLVLSYSDPSLVDSARTSFIYGADFPDKFGLTIHTRASRRHEGNHKLAVTLVSADGAQVGNPDSVMAMLLDRTTWWEKFLKFLSSPAGIAAIVVAGAAAALGVAKFILPRATCSIDSGRATLGPIPLRNSWPALHVDTAIGGISFSIPHPLPRGGRTDAEPSPA